jgi:methenyltetrahydrofolate cyclohydrolase
VTSVASGSPANGRPQSPCQRRADAYNHRVEDRDADPNSFRNLTLGQFVQRLASAEPVPGGGSAAAVAASLGAGLLTMVVSLSIGREKFAEHADTLEAAAATGRELADRFLTLADQDAAAFATYAAALRRPRETEAERDERTRAIAAAARTATEIPAACVEACLDLAFAIESIAGRSNPNASSDLVVGALLADAAAQAAAANVMINLPSVADQIWAGETTARVVEVLAAVDGLALITRETVGSGQARSPLPRDGR